MAVRVEQRNVILIGKTGGGKSTVVDRILGEQTQFGHAFTSEARSCLLQADDSMMYTVKVIDTVGVFDTKLGRGNEEVIKSYFLNEAPEGIHLVLFVAKHGRWTEEEKQTLQLLKKLFSDEVSAISALVFTGCEHLNTAKRRIVLQDFCEDKDRADIAKFMGKGLHTVGFPHLTSDMPPDLKAAYEPIVAADQEAIRQLIYKCEKRISSKDIFIKKKKKWFEIF